MEGILRIGTAHAVNRSTWIAAAIVLLTAPLPLAQTATQTATPAAAGPEADTIKALEHRVEAAIQSGDTGFLQAALGDDLRFMHASGAVASKSETLTGFAKAGRFLSRTITAVDVEVHNNAALSVGRIEVRPSAAPEYTLCYVRLYERRDDRWQLISHRTFRQRNGFDETCAPR